MRRLAGLSSRGRRGAAAALLSSLWYRRVDGVEEPAAKRTGGWLELGFELAGLELGEAAEAALSGQARDEAEHRTS